MTSPAEYMYTDNINEFVPTYSGLYKSLIQYIDISCLSYPPETGIGKETLLAFSRSISSLGLLRPIELTPSGALIDGRRRLAACIALGASRVPYVIGPTPLVFEDDFICRRLECEPMHFFEYAEELAVLTGRHLYSQESVAGALGRSQSFVANKLRLLAFTKEERALIVEKNLTERHCRALLRIKDEKSRLDAAKVASSTGMSVSALEEYVASFSGGASAEKVFYRELDRLVKSYEGRLPIACESERQDGRTKFRIEIGE